MNRQQIDRPIDPRMDRKTELKNSHTYRHTDGQINRQSDQLTYKQKKIKRHSQP